MQKKIVYYGFFTVVVLVLLALTFNLTSCKKHNPDPDPVTDQDKVRALLVSGTWKLQSTTVDGVDQSGKFSGFTLKFTATSFTSTNGNPVWPSSGTWAFQGSSATTIVRNDGTVVQLQATATTLILTLNWATTTLGPGRIGSIKGKYVFTMTQ